MGHVEALVGALTDLDTSCLGRWGAHLAQVLGAGGRLLAAGNGGSAAQAQHLTAELVGRFGAERRALSAIALHAETSSLTAVGNDYGFEEIFARQVRAHGRRGDVLVLLSTSGASANLLAAARVARAAGVRTWALTGPVPNALAEVCDEHLAVDAGAATVQECHLVAVHLLCARLDEILAAAPGPAPLAQEPSSPASGGVRLGIVGDLLADETVTGVVKRVCPDAPVPVVQDLRRALSPGGAGLAALLAARDGHDVDLVTAHDDGEVAEQVVAELRAAGVRVWNLGGGPVPVKTRVRADSQTVLMLDDARPAQSPGPLPGAAREALRGAQAVLVCDYGRAVPVAGDVREVIGELAGRVPVVWDPHPKGPAPVPGVTIAVPNDREAAVLCPEVDLPGPHGEQERARRLAQRWRVGHVAVTLDARGALLVSGGQEPALLIPAPVVPVINACGAGDRLAVSLAVGLAGGAVPSAALGQAVAQASAFAARRPVTEATKEQLPGLGIVERVRAAGGTVVATGGCFDLLHRGHVQLLDQARALGDCLVVCLNDDAGVRRLKGAPRPLVPVTDRAAVLAGLASVDTVVVFAEDTPEQVLRRLKPDVWVKGGDYAAGDLPERAVVENWGGRVVLLPYLDGRSTTALIDTMSAAGEGTR
jgi:D-beta-D-heptose 7-phosphate kinase/D-beta-D-heptose 1-phosphate adenosyltransferase